MRKRGLEYLVNSNGVFGKIDVHQTCSIVYAGHLELNKKVIFGCLTTALFGSFLHSSTGLSPCHGKHVLNSFMSPSIRTRTYTPRGRGGATLTGTQTARNTHAHTEAYTLTCTHMHKQTPCARACRHTDTQTRRSAHLQTHSRVMLLLVLAEVAACGATLSNPSLKHQAGARLSNKRRAIVDKHRNAWCGHTLVVLAFLPSPGTEKHPLRT